CAHRANGSGSRASSVDEAEQILELALGLEDLAALIHAGLEVDMMGAPELTRLLVLDPGDGLKLMARAAHANAAAGHFLAWNGHRTLHKSKGAARPGRGAEKKGAYSGLPRPRQVT